MDQKLQKKLTYNYVSRKLKKRNNRKECITTINNALFKYNIPYSRFIHYLKLNNIKLNRNILAYLAKKEYKSFKALLLNI